MIFWMIFWWTTFTVVYILQLFNLACQVNINLDLSFIFKLLIFIIYQLFFLQNKSCMFWQNLIPNRHIYDLLLFVYIFSIIDVILSSIFKFLAFFQSIYGPLWGHFAYKWEGGHTRIYLSWSYVKYFIHWVTIFQRYCGFLL